MTSQLLTFSKGNAKLGKDTLTFSIPAGYTCPGALGCKARADRDTGQIVDGKAQEYRCFSASQESAFRSVREARHRNLKALHQARTVEGMSKLILESLTESAKFVRVHVSGDFFSQTYFDAWMEVARARPGTQFYAYTKSIPFWVNRLDSIPDNFRLTASLGSKFDGLIDLHGLNTAEVVFHPEEAEAKGLEIDHDDTLARTGPPRSFALLVHGQGPKGSHHNAATKRMRDEGIKFSYARK